MSGANQEYDWGACPSCAQFERVNGAGTVLTDDVGTVNEGGIESWDLGEYALRAADHLSGCHVVLGLMPGADEAAVSVDSPIGKIRT